MAALRKSIRPAAVLLSIAAAIVVAPSLAPPSATPVGAPCYNGITPFNPYVDNCSLPQRPPHVLGAAPDQTAILNCSIGGQAWRAVCLSQYVNGGPYAGIAIGGG